MQTDRRVRYLDPATPPHISTLVILSALSALTMSVFLPSLPAMAEYFEADYSVLQLSVALYLAVNAILQIFVGPLSDYFGRRPVLLWSLAIFLLATLGCLLAPNATVFLVFRMAQAIIVSAMVLSRAVVRDTLGPAEAASMIGYVTMGMAIAPMVAPAIGGALEGPFGWQGSFYMLLVSGLAAFWLTWRDLGETAVRHSESLAAQMRTYPELLVSRRFWGYALTAAFASGAFFAYLGGAPFVGTEVYDMSPAVLGAALGAPAIGYAVGNGLTGRYTVRIGLDRMILLGAVLATLSLVLVLVLFLVGAGSATVFFGLMTVVGLGNGFVMPNATAGMLSVRPHLAGSASGLGGAIMIGGGAALAALAAAALDSGSGAMPLIWIMLITSLAAVATTAYTMLRARRVTRG